MARTYKRKVNILMQICSSRRNPGAQGGQNVRFWLEFLNRECAPSIRAADQLEAAGWRHCRVVAVEASGGRRRRPISYEELSKALSCGCEVEVVVVTPGRRLQVVLYREPASRVLAGETTNPQGPIRKVFLRMPQEERGEVASMLIAMH